LRKSILSQVKRCAHSSVLEEHEIVVRGTSVDLNDGWVEEDVDSYSIGGAGAGPAIERRDFVDYKVNVEDGTHGSGSAGLRGADGECGVPGGVCVDGENVYLTWHGGPVIGEHAEGLNANESCQGHHGQSDRREHCTTPRHMPS